jgi:hypothetical protein
MFDQGAMPQGELVAARLQEALGRIGRTRRWLHKQLESRSATREGGSYSAVHGYVEGNRVPDVSWIRAAAEVLQVRPEWLAFGTGGPTDLENAARSQGAGSAAARDPEVYTLYRAVLDSVPELAEMAGQAQAGFFELIARCMHFIPKEAMTPKNIGSLAAELWDAFKVPAQVFSGDRDESPKAYLNPWEYSNYLSAAIHAFMLALPYDRTIEAEASGASRRAKAKPPTARKTRKARRLRQGDQLKSAPTDGGGFRVRAPASRSPSYAGAGESSAAALGAVGAPPGKQRRA